MANGESTPRPRFISETEFASNWERTFGRTTETTGKVLDLMESLRESLSKPKAPSKSDQ